VGEDEQRGVSRGLVHTDRRKGLYGGKFGGDGHLAFQLCLIAFEGLLFAVFKVVASMMFRKAVLAAELCLAMWAFPYNTKDRRSALGFFAFKLTSFLAGHSN